MGNRKSPSRGIHSSAKAFAYPKNIIADMMRFVKTLGPTASKKSWEALEIRALLG